MLAAVVAVFVVAGDAGARDVRPLGSERGVPGIDWRWPNRALVRVDPLTFRQVGQARARLDEFASFTSVSPDRALLLAAPQDRAVLRLVDLARFRVIRDIELAGTGTIDEMEWLDPTHVAVVVRDGLRASTVHLVDVRAPEATRSFRFRGMDVGYFRRADRRLVSLAAPMTRIGVTRVLVFALDAPVRVGVVSRIPKGRLFRAALGRSVVAPGLAVDSRGNRAFVVDRDGTVAEVGLGDLSVVYHEARETAAAERLEKEITGWQLQARWERGRIVVAGYRSTPARSLAADGLRIIDTRSWVSRRLDPKGDSFFVAGDRLVAGVGRGMTGFTLGGKRLWRLEVGSRWTGAYSVTRPYLYVDRMDRTVAVADVRSGRVLRVVREPSLRPLRDSDVW